MTSNMETTGANAELIVEAVVENLGLKQKLFADLEAASSATCILATNTSSLPVSAAYCRGSRLSAWHTVLSCRRFDASVMDAAVVCTGWGVTGV